MTANMVNCRNVNLFSNFTINANVHTQKRPESNHCSDSSQKPIINCPYQRDLISPQVVASLSVGSTDKKSPFITLLISSSDKARENI